jgi:hypothetical protein
MPESLVAERIAQRNAMGAGRADDADMAAVKKRVSTFNHVTMPAINWMRVNKNVVFTEVPITNDTPDVNYQKLKTILNTALAQNNIILK